MGVTQSPDGLQFYKICFIPKTKRANSYKEYQENNVLSVLKTVQCKLIHVTWKTLHCKLLHYSLDIVYNFFFLFRFRHKTNILDLETL